MPSKGYRKGLTDSKYPVTRFVRTRVSDPEYDGLLAEADARVITLSKLVRALIVGHLNHQRAELPHPRATSDAALRELTRVGNNLNQLAKQANLGLVPVSATELRTCLMTILDAVRRL